MHRLLVAKGLLTETVPQLPKEAARHLKVLRPRSGETIELFDGSGAYRVYEFGADGELQAVSAIENQGRNKVELTLFACVTKGSRWDWTIEKATELGVTRIVPVISDRTIVRIPQSERSVKRDRWQRIAEEAARQSDAKWLPEILEPVDFRDSLAMAASVQCFIGALTTPPSPMLAAAVNKSLAQADGAIPSRVAVYVGPEGDFTPDELSELMRIATPTSFGSTILRAETAAIFALSVVKGILDR